MQPDSLSQQILACAYKVSNALGAGFVEKVYENALAHELGKAGISYEQQKEIEVNYDGVVVGRFICDLLVQDRILLELKAVHALNELHLAQGLNFLKATRLPVCLLLNFGTPKLEVRRLVPGRHWDGTDNNEPVINGDER